MTKGKFHAVYNETSGAVVIFHALPVELVGKEVQKVAYVSEGFSSIIIEGELEKFVGKELGYMVRDAQLIKKPAAEIKRFESSMKLQALREEIKRSISAKVPIGEEMQRTKAYLEWIKDGQPDNDVREKDFVEIQDIINNIKQEHAGSKAELIKTLEKLDKPVKTKSK